MSIPYEENPRDYCLVIQWRSSGERKQIDSFSVIQCNCGLKEKRLRERFVDTKKTGTVTFSYVKTMAVLAK